MTVSELVQAVKDAEAFGQEAGMEPVFNLVLQRECRGSRARVFPGVSGEVMDVHGGVSVVLVKAAAVRRFLERNGHAIGT